MGNGKFALILAVLISVGVAAWPSVTQKSVVQGVTVAVTPGNLSPDATIWDFAVAYDAGATRQLKGDEPLDQFVLLGDGRRMKPLAWEGDKDGTKHRAGVLKFIAIQPRPKELELQLQRPAEKQPRVFRFVFGDWSA
ncbi:hypothetical protein H8N03_09755 [Ramlibacter sp. USB13]|uniref:Uncharacterized protein n=1 Tax=Ramlibacter cellulosilyticus TaxID=2764187 RepID=A0A923MR05_9BURK|nr:hypothetical protein [Ramlibacter cellulosilyticus]MBC5783228.1 hypothetical protein [Ramlibacter cellulosilyticus]